MDSLCYNYITCQLLYKIYGFMKYAHIKCHFVNVTLVNLYIKQNLIVVAQWSLFPVWNNRNARKKTLKNI